MNFPESIQSVEELDRILAVPADAVVEAVRELPGDLMLLGVGGKMGPSLALLAQNAIRQAGLKKKVYGVARFSSDGTQEYLQSAGIHTIRCDVMDDAAMQRLPDVENVVYMVGMKFGATGREAQTWAINSYLPGRVCEKFKNSRIVLFSTGCVYPLVEVSRGGSRETDPPEPVGEYAQSALGRERVFEHFSRQYGIPGLIFRLNYAIDLRYGVLLDVARKVHQQQPIGLEMGHANVIWQGDANAIVLRSFALTESPPSVLNVTGPETVSIRMLAQRFGEIFGIEPVFEKNEAPTALLSNAARCFRHFGYPQVPLEQMIAWTAAWVQQGGVTYNKPTNFETRSGKF